ncbi:hypothetical protein N481_21765 [Pseudoalteromonas luteoviolacea S4047-1]|uniref:Uncharacterized protein n=1 Tax=Pseudoalteromonas luteoviolacea S4054 TaxID=1129367 RepID=A0A0F6A7E7_9GAMM|nr:hypothetical protein N479_19330 [Pseudoalteromonas luteoviolacea S4054]KZN69679.1 hypothetical protein N481_21765 [Pseudoalteromonas luteoviolacea S4047-1]
MKVKREKIKELTQQQAKSIVGGTGGNGGGLEPPQFGDS